MCSLHYGRTHEPLRNIEGILVDKEHATGFVIRKATMSFGFGVCDFVKLVELAWKIYKSCKDSPESFKNVSQEVLSLHVVLKEAEEILSGHPLSQSKEASLATITRGCEDVLQDLQSLVLKYDSLGSKTKRTWDRLRWHSDDIAELRARLTSNTVLLTAYMR